MRSCGGCNNFGWNTRTILEPVDLKDFSSFESRLDEAFGRTFFLREASLHRFTRVIQPSTLKWMNLLILIQQPIVLTLIDRRTRSGDSWRHCCQIYKFGRWDLRFGRWDLNGGTWDLVGGTCDLDSGTWSVGLGTWTVGLGTWTVGLGRWDLKMFKN